MRRLALLAVIVAIMICRPAAAGKEYSHQQYFEHYQGTATCLECHEDAAEAFFHSQHYSGAAPPPRSSTPTAPSWEK